MLEVAPPGIYASGCLYTQLVTATVPCMVIATDERMQSASAVPTDPSQMEAPPLVTARKNVADPLAAASLSDTIAFAVATPATAAANAGFANVGEASKVCVEIAVSAVIGRAPAYRRTAPPFKSAHSASAAAFAAAALSVIAI